MDEAARAIALLRQGPPRDETPSRRARRRVPRKFAELALDVAQRGWAYPDELYELAAGQLGRGVPPGVVYGDPRSSKPTIVLGVPIETRRRTEDAAPPETGNPGTR